MTQTPQNGNVIAAMERKAPIPASQQPHRMGLCADARSEGSICQCYHSPAAEGSAFLQMPPPPSSNSARCRGAGGGRCLAGLRVDSSSHLSGYNECEVDKALLSSSFQAPGYERRLGMGCLLVLGAIIAASVIAGLRASHRASNEHSASTVLHILKSAEADFRTNDRDGNGIVDFWTGDVAGLFRYGLIERSVAEADAHPLVPLVPRPIPKDGYYFVALDRDEPMNPPVEYRQETDKKSGKVHNRSKFGFCAYPAEPGVTGNFIYVVNENNSVFRAAASLPVPTSWFTQEERTTYWTLPQ